MPVNFFKPLQKLLSSDVILISLLIILIPSASSVGIFNILPQVIIGVFIAVLFELLSTYIKKERYYFPETAVITGLIIAMVLPVGTNPMVTIVATVIAITIKQFVNFKKLSMFNPIAYSLFVTATIFNIKLGWWGDTFPLLVIILGAIVVFKAKKGWQAFSFVISYIILEALFIKSAGSGVSTALKNAIVTNSWLFTFFLVSEPGKMVRSLKLKVSFGVIVALVAINLSTIKLGIISNNSLLLGLLLANLITFFYLYLGEKESKSR